ncbi:hypothetical protein PTTW11_11233 [Pyrenophora teres f. teres]|uniref:Uncharacterized protein n=1 Tax=Pyrenophora teres f. teres TaxID=97479 RepID=A0A6S6WGP9_9PLEO|nr:hypothetical protein PTTW11_11233 [Pyrenophora teres f. teres]
MASSDQNIWFSEQPPFFSSLDTTIASGSSDTFNSHLPPIPEENWDFGWDEHMFNLPDPYEGFEQTSTTAVEHATNDNTSPQAHEELIKLQNEVQQLRHDISELHEMYCKRLDSMEATITVARRYVDSLVPWSMEVHEKYSKLLDMARQERLVADRSA